MKEFTEHVQQIEKLLLKLLEIAGDDHRMISKVSFDLERMAKNMSKVGETHIGLNYDNVHGNTNARLVVNISGSQYADYKWAKKHLEQSSKNMEKYS